MLPSTFRKTRGMAVLTAVVACHAPVVPVGAAHAANTACTLGTHLDGEHAGPVRIGMPIAELMSACPGTRVIASRDDEGRPAEIARVPTADGDSMAAGLDTVNGIRVVRDISVWASTARSPAGFGVGSTVGILRAKKGRWERGLNEGVVYVSALPDDGISLRLSVLYDSIEATWQPSGLDGIPDSVRVIELVVRGIQR